ncbi:hypothetical protein GC175_13045 [bacterium]|nr:hypothetical protein [bacterium]
MSMSKSGQVVTHQRNQSNSTKPTKPTKTADNIVLSTGLAFIFAAISFGSPDFPFVGCSAAYHDVDPTRFS